MKTYAFSIILSLLVIHPPAYSQSKSDTVEFKIQKKFIDRKMAWYLNVTGLLMNTGREDFFGVGGGTTVEKKLWNSSSISASLNLFHVSHDLWFMNNSSGYTSLNLDLNYRYYLNLKNRMRTGLTGNNFNANYIVLAPYFLFFYKPYRSNSIQWDFEKGEWIIKTSRKIELQPYLKVGYGIQRSIWKDLYVDINSGFQINQLPDFDDPFSLMYLNFNLKYIIK
ncbi:MAG TPA: hypothetical protein VK179_05545 [Bacteroidales bacterium]|nr:hypothetical protein [Bacteroidales bacterium]